MKVKTKTKGLSKRGAKTKFDWDSLRKEFSAAQEATGIKFKTWCEEKGISFETARAHIDAKGGDRFRVSQYKEKRAAFKKVISSLTSEADGKLYIKSLKQSIHILDELMISSGAIFTHLTEEFPAMSAFDAGKLAISSSSALREMSLELQGIPDDDEEFGWPLTKGFWPHDYQRDFIFDLPSNMRAKGEDIFIFAFIGGIGSGKTRCGAEKAGDLAWRNRGCHGAIYAPTYKMLRDATLDTFMGALVEKGISYVYKKSDESLLLFGDTKIFCRSLDDPDHLRGPEIAWYWIDEGGQLPDRKAFDVVQGRVRAPDASEAAGIMTTTPNGLNWLYEVAVEDAVKNKVRVYKARTDQNIALGSEYFERLRNTYDERFAKQELLAEWLNVFQGQAYWNFERSRHSIPKLAYDPALPLILCFDLNVDPMCWNVIQTHREGPHLIDWVIDEIHVRTASTEETAKEFLARYRAHKAGVVVYGDATCRAHSTNTSRTDYEIIKEVLKPLPAVEIRVGASNPLVTDRVAAVNARLKDMNGHIKLLFDSKCIWTIKDFEKVSFKQGTRELDKSDKTTTHHSDGIGYYINREYPIRKVRVEHGK